MFICSRDSNLPSQFSLVPIRTGLHKLLRRNLDPQAGENVSAVRLYEKAALEESCRQLLRLIQAATREEPSPTKAEYICADQPTTLTFRLRKSGGPHIYAAIDTALKVV